MSSLSPYPIPSSLHTMSNHQHHHHHHHNYADQNPNSSYSIPQQLSENNVNVPNDTSSNSSCLIQTPIVDYYGQHSYHQTSSRTHPLYSHQTHHLYQENPNHLYRYNVLPSSSSSPTTATTTSSSTSTNNITQKYISKRISFFFFDKLNIML